MNLLLFIEKIMYLCSPKKNLEKGIHHGTCLSTYRKKSDGR